LGPALSTDFGFDNESAAPLPVRAEAPASEPGTTGLLLGGFLLLALGGMAGLAYLAMAALALGLGEIDAGIVVAAGASALLLALLGWNLIRGGTAAARGIPGRRFGPSSPLPWLSALALLLVLGSSLLSVAAPSLLVLVFPPLHLAAAMLPALAVIAYAARRCGSPDWLVWRGVLGRMAWGAGVATSIAMIGEILAGLGLGGAVLWSLDQTSSGSKTLDALRELPALLESPEGLTTLDPGQIQAFLHPAVVLAIFLLFAFLGPIIEESAKLGGVLFRPPESRSQAWAWGVAVGAGFGIFEGLLFGAMDLSPLVWPLALMARMLSTLMHASMTGLAGLGWYIYASERRRLTGLLRIGLAFAGHGLWNGLVLSAVLAQLRGQGSLAAAASISLFALFNLIFFSFLTAPSLPALTRPPADPPLPAA
jgi:hypothetical protein